jgi:hypothetical protein
MLRHPQLPRGFVPTSSGGFVVGDLGALWALEPGGLTEHSRGFYGDVADVAVLDGGVFAAVNTCATAACQSKIGRVWTRSGPGSWELLQTSQPFGGEILALLAVPPDTLLAGVEGGVARHQASGWTTVPINANADQAFTDLALCGGTVMTVGGAGTQYQGTPLSLSPRTNLGAVLHALSGTRAGNVFGAGNGALFENGTFLYSTTFNDFIAYRAVYSPGPGEAYAFGLKNYGVWWNGAELSPIESPGGVYAESYEDLWGSSIDNLYLVGKAVAPVTSGVALRFDGAFWRAIDSGSSRAVTAVTGASPTEVWLGTEGGGVLRAVPP